MRGIGIDGFTDDELVLLENAYGTSSHGQEIKRVVAEIRRLRAENKELRASYERVDRARRELQKPFTSGRGFA